MQSIIKLAQSFARRSEGSVRHAVAGSIDQSKGKHGHDIVRHYNLYKLVMVHVLVGYRRFYSYIYTPRFFARTFYEYCNLKHVYTRFKGNYCRCGSAFKFRRHGQGTQHP